jgi:hypothetical protein
MSAQVNGTNHYFEMIYLFGQAVATSVPYVPLLVYIWPRNFSDRGLGREWQNEQPPRTYETKQLVSDYLLDGGRRSPYHCSLRYAPARLMKYPGFEPHSWIASRYCGYDAL